MHQILIVEDDPALSQGIRLALGQEGRQFVQAGTIGQAERELAERTFDLLILDLNLPDGNGLDLLSRLRDRSALPVLLYHGPVRVTRAGAAARIQICPEIPARPLTKKTACAILHTLQ